MKLDVSTIAELALPPGKIERIYWDDELRGFGLRLRRRGNQLHRTWVAQYRVDGRQRRTSFGALETVRPAEARAAARKLLAAVALGSDPQGEKAARRRAAARTFRAVAAAYLEARAKELRISSYRTIKIYLAGPNFFRPLAALAISAITHADVAACIRAIEGAYGRSTVIGARSALSTLFAWAIAEGLMAPPNPVIGTRRPPAAPGRDRVLSNAELAAIWNATGSDDDHDRIVRLLILTGARAKEIGGMRWSELAEAGTWSLPKERSKNHRPHEIVLSVPARAIIAGIERRPGREPLFGVQGDRGFTAWARQKLKLDLRLAASNIRPWWLHDIRRTVATGMADIGVAPHIIEAVLNHQSGHRSGVASVYNRSRYVPEVTAALARWGQHVLALAEGRADKVTLRAS